MSSPSSISYSDCAALRRVSGRLMCRNQFKREQHASWGGSNLHKVRDGRLCVLFAPTGQRQMAKEMRQALTRAVSGALWFGPLCESSPVWSTGFAILQCINILPLKIDISVKALCVQ